MLTVCTAGARSLGFVLVSTAGLNVLLIAVARTLVMEAGLGITLGHDDARQFVQWWLQRLGKPAG